MINISMTDSEFKLLRDIIYNYCGIYFDQETKYLVERRLNQRLQKKKLRDFSQYCSYLNNNQRVSNELDAIVDLITNNETYFFRTDYQLATFSRHILPQLFRQNHTKKNLRIWSAGCSSGEEPYTLAILIKESKLPFGDWNIEIFGSDISKKVLETARRGIYHTNSFRNTDHYRLNKYFKKSGQDTFIINKDIKEMVLFGQMNLLDPKCRQIKSKDLIVCRNVLIYFDQKVKNKVIELFYHKLYQGGYLLLGHSENLLNVQAPFKTLPLANDVIYQKSE